MQALKRSACDPMACGLMQLCAAALVASASAVTYTIADGCTSGSDAASSSATCTDCAFQLGAQVSGAMYNTSGPSGSSFDGSDYVVNCSCDQSPIQWDLQYYSDGVGLGLDGPHSGCHQGSTNFQITCDCSTGGLPYQTPHNATPPCCSQHCATGETLGRSSAADGHVFASVADSTSPPPA